MTYAFADLRAEYARLWASMKIDTGCIAELGAEARQLFSVMPIYRGVEVATGVPASVIAVIHNRESGRNFHCHLHNGDPLTQRTYHVPAGRPPPPAEPPFTWTASAIDALRYEGLDKITDWSLERAAFSLEAYNGFGYRQYHNEPSPYLWGGTNVQQPGKYDADGQFNRSSFDTQLGCLPLLYTLWQLDRSLALKPASDPAPPVPAAPEPWAADRFQAVIAKGGDPIVAWGQWALNQLTPSAGLEEDGDSGPFTKAAVRGFERARKLAVDAGTISPEVIAELKRVLSQTGA